MNACPKPVKQTRKRRKVKKTERQILKKSLDAIVPQIVKQRDGWQCVQCGDRSRPTNGHIIVCGVYGTRWDLANNHCQCATCNLIHRNKAHLYIEWFQRNFGDEMWHELVRRSAKKESEWTTPELRELLERYQDLYERMQHLGVYDHSMLVAIGAYGQLKGITE